MSQEYSFFARPVLADEKSTKEGELEDTYHTANCLADVLLQDVDEHIFDKVVGNKFVGDNILMEIISKADGVNDGFLRICVYTTRRDASLRELHQALRDNPEYDIILKFYNVCYRLFHILPEGNKRKVGKKVPVNC